MTINVQCSQLYTSLVLEVSVFKMTNKMTYVLLNIIPIFLIPLIMVVLGFIALCSICWAEDKGGEKI